MKKVLAVLAAAALIFSAVSCASDDVEAEDIKAAAVEETVAEAEVEETVAEAEVEETVVEAEVAEAEVAEEEEEEEAEVAEEEEEEEEEADAPVEITYPVPEGEEEIADDFEADNIWQAVGDTWDQWGSHNLSLEAEASDEWASEGTYSGKWTFDVAGPDTSKQASFFTYAVDPDWTDVKYLALDVLNNTGRTIFLKANVQNNVNWNWSTSPDIIEIPVGVSYNVTFAFEDVVDEAESITCLIIDVADENDGGTIYVDNIRLYR